ncbi:MAG: pectate lyase [Prevotella sp.]|nr:pectate lyase [Prevotella sp.]
MRKSIFKSLLLLCLCMAATVVFAEEKTPAFPGAEGFGRYVTGGRGGNVYHVTSLADDGSEGTLRWALGKSGVKTIVFDVSGTIHLQSSLDISIGNVTIAGQTAPGDGICVADYPVSIKANNVIVRYMRFRLGNKNVLANGADGWDGFGGFDQQDWIIDHCSVSWSIDECLSVLGNKNTTVQWCLVAQSLVNSGHSKGAHGYGGNWGGSGASFHHNLIAHHGSRTPRLGPRPTTQLDERMDMRNNVIYNFGGNGCYGGEGMNVNIVNNYYKPGPGTPTDKKGYRIAGIGIRTNTYVNTYPAYAPALHLWGKYYVTGNYNSKYPQLNQDNWTYGIINQIDASGCDGTFTQETKDSIKLAEPIDYILTTTHSAADAYDRVLDFAGASLHRDSFDELMVSDTRNGKATYTGSGLSKGFVNSQDDNKPSDADASWSAWPTLASKEAPKDTDGDGMPDEWELANALDPTNPKDGKTIGADGYSNLENYLNSLVADITTAQNMGGETTGSTVNESEEPVTSTLDITPETANGDWTFSNGCSITISTAKSYSTSKSCGIQSIKYSNNVTYTIHLPEGVAVSSIDFTGFTNEDNVDGYLAELNGKTFSASDYVFPSRTGNKAVTYNVKLDTPASGSVSVKFVKQVGMRMTLNTISTTGISHINLDNDSDSKTFNLGGQFTGKNSKGIVIQNGKKIIK